MIVLNRFGVYDRCDTHDLAVIELGRRVVVALADEN